MKKFSHVIVRRPCRAMVDGITSAPELGKPDYELALKEHDDYIAALKQCDVDVTVLEADERYPDSCFVEDPALITRKCAIITNPGAASRNGEKNEIIGAVKKGIKVIAVPRLAQYGEHVDDHQIQLLEQFDGMGIIQACYNLNDLEACYLSVQTASFQSYKSSTNEIIESIEAFLNQL